MEWLPAVVPLAALVLKEVLSYKERQGWAAERARLIAAALATSPETAAAAVRPPRIRDEDRVRPVMPIGI